MSTSATLQVRLEAAAFPADLFRICRLTGREAISQLFSFDVELVSRTLDGTADIDAAVGADAAIVFEQVDGGELRRIHGMIAEARDLVTRSRLHRTYRVRVVPRAFRLSLVETSEVFMEKAVPDLIKSKLELVGLSGADVALRLLGSYAPREFTVQYQETDLAFISRLAEHLGISYFFQHDGGQDTMVFTDHGGGFDPLPEPLQLGEQGQERDVQEIEARLRVIPSVYVVRDYNYRQPLLDLTAEHTAPGGYAGGIIEFGGHHKTPAEGKALAEVRAGERQAAQRVYAGRSKACALGAGARFTVEGLPGGEALDLLAVEVEHEINVPPEDGGRAGVEQHYTNSFRATPAKQTYRPPRVTPRPRISGLVTGIVDAGSGGGSSYAQIDEQGRYMVRLLFDTAASGGTVSRPIRMLQNHAGANYGTHFPLKPGVEVLVGFVNGDPDRPVIVGAAPNPLTPSPVVNANRTTHRIKTQAGIVIDLVDE